ncbi:MFS transporter [Blastococcus xanthinilyticus]|uniref:MFS transporter n=1 Tax=Blastococcus xanthinilyticus TaxID=1564164 RepID=UPI00141217AE|nr:MFS transporter [Blastococcus xanthinilyticus]
MSAAAVQRRYVGLTALRWLPLGITVPVIVLLASARGLTLTEIGLTVAVHSIVAVALELPTGGLADAIGHRPVLVLSAVLGGAGLLTMAAAQDVAVFALAYGLIGAGRALDSGPLESWFVDATHAADPDADTTPGLSRAAAASGLGLAVGAVLGGVVPLLAEGAGTAVLTLPFLVAAGVDVVYLLAIVVLVTPLRTPAAHTSGAAALLRGCRDVPRLIRETGRLTRADAVLRRLLLLSGVAGLVFGTLELLGPLRFAELAGSPAEGTAVFGIVMAASFAAASVGSVLAGRVRRAAGGSTAVATATVSVLAAVAVAATALSPVLAVAAVTYALFYLVNAAGWPLRQQLMHTRVTAEHRATTVSVAALALQAGGIVGSLVVARIAEATSITTGFGVAVAALLLAALVCLRLRVPAAPVGAGTAG